TSTATSGAKTYSTPGTYTMKLTVTGPGGSGTATKTITATAAAPVANFTASPTSGTAPLDVTFTNSSTGNISSYAWNFGDGSSSTAQDPFHTYSSTGTYTVDLTATGPGGTNTQTRTGYVTVSAMTGGGTSTGLVAAYTFEEKNGTTVVDASGKGNNGTISGATRINQGRFGKALSFDGNGNVVTVNDAASLDLTTGMTIEAWVYPINPSANWTPWHPVVMKAGSTNTNGSTYGAAAYVLYASTDTDQAATGVFTNGSWLEYLKEGPTLATNTWTHIAGTYNGTTQRLYINGEEVANSPLTDPIQVSDGVLYIGGTPFWGEFFRGYIDEIRVYNRALTAAEIRSDMGTAIAASSLPDTMIGILTVEPAVDSNPQDKAQAFPTKGALTGTTTSLPIYLNAGSTAAQLVAGLYTDNGGNPETVPALGSLSSPKAGRWNKATGPAASLRQGWRRVLDRDPNPSSVYIPRSIRLGQWRA
ncbi:MAG: PKD domain-containing protein, partial [Gammaproteobacteria bacterium]|nr:PKD domain-containing protein [Gammaproteobacteria bacterium]